MSDALIELRCPYFPSTRFADVRDPGPQTHVEVACRSCERAARLSADLRLRIVHVFDAVTGECVDTRETPKP